MNYFNIVKYDQKITLLKNGINDCMYLVEGSNKALLIDTGTGYGHLAEEVEYSGTF